MREREDGPFMRYKIRRNDRKETNEKRENSKEQPKRVFNAKPRSKTCRPCKKELGWEKWKELKETTWNPAAQMVKRRREGNEETRKRPPMRSERFLMVPAEEVFAVRKGPRKNKEEAKKKKTKKRRAWLESGRFDNQLGAGARGMTKKGGKKGGQVPKGVFHQIIFQCPLRFSTVWGSQPGGIFWYARGWPGRPGQQAFVGEKRQISSNPNGIKLATG